MSSAETSTNTPKSEVKMPVNEKELEFRANVKLLLGKLDERKQKLEKVIEKHSK